MVAVGVGGLRCVPHGTAEVRLVAKEVEEVRLCGVAMPCRPAPGMPTSV